MPSIRLSAFLAFVFSFTLSTAQARSRCDDQFRESRGQTYTALESRSDDIRERLFAELQSTHRPIESYQQARQAIFTTLHRQKLERGYYVFDVYCQELIPVQPNRLPDSNVINVEHTWPQSRFSRSFSKSMQKSDLHHLFPTDSLINQKRGNFQFGEVVSKIEELKCPESQLGRDQNRNIRFAPPVAHRGNVARALFYFAVRYKLAIAPDEEANLRKWHKEDPVDEEEMERNALIEKIQGDRNPFIDHPELVDDISDF